MVHGTGKSGDLTVAVNGFDNNGGENEGDRRAPNKTADVKETVGFDPLRQITLRH